MSDLTICIQYVGQFVDKQAIVVIPKNVMCYVEGHKEDTEYLAVKPDTPYRI